MASVPLQHLDPNRPSLLSEIIDGTRGIEAIEAAGGITLPRCADFYLGGGPLHLNRLVKAPARGYRGGSNCERLWRFCPGLE